MVRSVSVVVGVFIVGTGGLTVWQSWWLAAGEGAFCEDLARDSGGSAAELVQRMEPYVAHRHVWLTGLGIAQIAAGVALAGISAAGRRGKGEEDTIIAPKASR